MRVLSNTVLPLDRQPDVSTRGLRTEAESARACEQIYRGDGGYGRRWHDQAILAAAGVDIPVNSQLMIAPTRDTLPVAILAALRIQRTFVAAPVPPGLASSEKIH